MTFEEYTQIVDQDIARVRKAKKERALLTKKIARNSHLIKNIFKKYGINCVVTPWAVLINNNFSIYFINDKLNLVYDSYNTSLVRLSRKKIKTINLIHLCLEIEKKELTNIMKNNIELDILYQNNDIEYNNKKYTHILSVKHVYTMFMDLRKLNIYDVNYIRAVKKAVDLNAANINKFELAKEIMEFYQDTTTESLNSLNLV